MPRSVRSIKPGWNKNGWNKGHQRHENLELSNFQCNITAKGDATMHNPPPDSPSVRVVRQKGLLFPC